MRLGRKLGLAALAVVIVLIALPLVAWQVVLARGALPLITPDIAHFIAGSSGPQGPRGVSHWPDIALDPVLQAAARKAWDLAVQNSGGADRVSAACVAVLLPTGFLSPPPPALARLRLRGARVVNPTKCFFSSGSDIVSYRTTALIRRRAWLLWIGRPQVVDTAGAYSIEVGYWAEALHGASWRCRMDRVESGFEVDSCDMRWVS